MEPDASAVLALALGVHSSAAVPRPAASSFMPLRCARQVPELRQGMVGCDTVDRYYLARARRRCTQRSGIKEEAAALGRNGGQPRS
jgi:hypothetical protein